MMQKVKEDEAPTPEELEKIKQYNKKRHEYLKEHLPLLGLEEKFEEHLFKIEHFRYNTLLMKMKTAELKAPPQPTHTPQEAKK